VTGRRLLAAVRDGDVVARLGGDEFGIVLGGATDAATLRRRSELIRSSVEAPLRFGTAEICVGASIGVVPLPAHAEPLRPLIDAADKALYDAKRGAGVVLVLQPLAESPSL
jgi:diguanylate cyclase